MRIQMFLIFLLTSPSIYGQDIGAWFVSRTEIPPYRFVVLDDQLDCGVRLADCTDFYVFGIVNGATDVFTNDPTKNEHGSVPISLMGKLIVEVSPGLEIRRGDPIGSGKHGYAIRANDAARPTYLYRYSNGQPVGYAIEDQRQGKVKIFFK